MHCASDARREKRLHGMQRVVAALIGHNTRMRFFPSQFKFSLRSLAFPLNFISLRATQQLCGRDRSAAGALQHLSRDSLSLAMSHRKFEGASAPSPAQLAACVLMMLVPVPAQRPATVLWASCPASAAATTAAACASSLATISPRIAT